MRIRHTNAGMKIDTQAPRILFPCDLFASIFFSLIGRKETFAPGLGY
jgi:hypothetical protein